MCVCAWSPISPQTPVNSINIYCVLCARPCSQCCGLYQDKSYKVPGFGELTIRITHIWLAPFPLQGNFRQSYVITQAGHSLRHAGTWAAGAGGRGRHHGGWGNGTAAEAGSQRAADGHWGLRLEVPAPQRGAGRCQHQKGRVLAALAYSSVIRQPCFKAQLCH